MSTYFIRELSCVVNAFVPRFECNDSIFRLSHHTRMSATLSVFSFAALEGRSFIKIYFIRVVNNNFIFVCIWKQKIVLGGHEQSSLLRFELRGCDPSNNSVCSIQFIQPIQVCNSFNHITATHICGLQTRSEMMQSHTNTLTQPIRTQTWWVR